MEIVNRQSSGGTWTIKTVNGPSRGPVTKKVVGDLAKNKSLRDVAKVAKKYAK